MDATTTMSVPRRALTPRQIDVLALAADGCGSAEIAARLGVSANTVKTHLLGVYRRLGARNAAHAVALAMRAGILDPGQRRRAAAAGARRRLAADLGPGDPTGSGAARQADALDVAAWILSGGDLP